jgi:hypothetical protein
VRSVLLSGGTTAPAGTQNAGAGLRAGGRGKGIAFGAQHADVFYLWVMIGLELLATVMLRSWSRHHHGG